MDIYVISSVWLGQGATVIGAATDLDTAEAIGARNVDFSWTPWNDRIDSWRAERNVRERFALDPDGRVHPHLSQEIVCVPLAGMVTTGDRISPRLREQLQREISRMPVYYDAMQSADVEKPRWAELVKKMAELRNRVPPFSGPIKVGRGPAMDWLRRGLDSMATYPAEKALPDSVAARVLGFDVVLDPNLPPDVIRLGSKVFIVDVDRVYETDEDHLWSTP